ncbi:MAG: hypothetical protein HQM13_21020 [SAR324 cluster bacterium]|nr:hypothetical protein [SAR324 cluster bacterium]
MAFLITFLEKFLMAKFKAELSADLLKELNSFLKEEGLTGTAFLKLAIQAKKKLISHGSRSKSVSKTNKKKSAGTSVTKKTSPAKKTAAERKSDRVKKPSTTGKAGSLAQSASKKAAPLENAVVKKTAAAEKKGFVRKNEVIPSTTTISSTQKKILETNRKLYDRFVEQAGKKRMGLQAYAKKIGLDLKEIERIRTEKAIRFVPKLKDALEINR